MKEIALVCCRPPGFDRMAFIASTERDRELLQKARIGEGEVLIFKRPLIRNGKHHRLVFAMLRFVFENQDRYQKEDDLREALTLKTSFVRRIKTLGGRWEKRARSWSYSELDEADFAQLHKELIDVILTEIWPGQTQEWLRAGVDHQAMTENLLEFA